MTWQTTTWAVLCGLLTLALAATLWRARQVYVTLLAWKALRPGRDAGPYRTAATSEPEVAAQPATSEPEVAAKPAAAEPKRHKGPRVTCSKCGSSSVFGPQYCTAVKPLMLTGGTFWKKNYCTIGGQHLHQGCRYCGGWWICDTVEAS